MTIAACYVSPEGVVLGSDSTSTYADSDRRHYFNHAQKIFEIGQDSTLGIVTWGLGGLSVSSHRMQIALLADKIKRKPSSSVQAIASRWSVHYGTAYRTADTLKPVIAACKLLAAKSPYIANANPPAPNARTESEEKAFSELMRRYTVGFCIGGYVRKDRSPAAFSVIFDPLNTKPTPAQINIGSHMFWGVPNMYKRLVLGCDEGLFTAIAESPNWTGTSQDLANLVQKVVLKHPILPIRDAIDFTYACIYSTIKALKFSMLPQICGGPIEIAVITADRPFRWVRHKAWDRAITDGEP